MRIFLQGGILLAALFFSCVSVAGPVTSSTVDKLMILSGISKQSEGVSGMVLASVQQARQGTQMSDSEFEAISQSMADAFKARDFVSTAAMEVSRVMSEEEAAILLSWYQSDIAKKITREEENASTAEAYQEMIQQAQTLLENQEKVAFAQKLDQLIKMSEMSYQMQLKSATTVVTAMSSVMNKGQAVNLDGFMAQMAAQEQQMRTNSYQMSILTLAYNYRNIEQPVLDKYLEILQEPAMSKFTDATSQGFQIAFDQAIDKMARSIAKVFEEYKKP